MHHEQHMRPPLVCRPLRTYHSTHPLDAEFSQNMQVLVESDPGGPETGLNHLALLCTTFFQLNHCVPLFPGWVTVLPLVSGLNHCCTTVPGLNHFRATLFQADQLVAPLVCRL